MRTSCCSVAESGHEVILASQVKESEETRSIPRWAAHSLCEPCMWQGWLFGKQYMKQEWIRKFPVLRSEMAGSGEQVVPSLLQFRLVSLMRQLFFNKWLRIWPVKFS